MLTGVNTVCFEIGFQLIKIQDYPDFQPLAAISAVSCFAPIFCLLLAIMLYWSTFRQDALYTRNYLYDNGGIAVKLTSLKSRKMHLLIALIDLV